MRTALFFAFLMALSISNQAKGEYLDSRTGPALNSLPNEREKVGAYKMLIDEAMRALMKEELAVTPNAREMACAKYKSESENAHCMSLPQMHAFRCGLPADPSFYYKGENCTLTRIPFDSARTSAGDVKAPVRSEPGGTGSGAGTTLDVQ